MNKYMVSLMGKSLDTLHAAPIFEMYFPAEVTDTVFLTDLKTMAHWSWRASGQKLYCSGKKLYCLRNCRRSDTCVGSFTVQTRRHRD